jgi:hypothetical protein
MKNTIFKLIQIPARKHIICQDATVARGRNGARLRGFLVFDTYFQGESATASA